MDVGLIGVGAMGKNHARILSELKNVNSLHIYDIDAKTACEVANKYSANMYTSLNDFVRNIDVIDICAPTKFHHSLLEKTLDSNLPTFIEKPFCINLKESYKIYERLNKNILYGVGHIERFNPIIYEIKKIIENPLYISTARHNPSSTRITDVSVIEDLMIHDIDVIFHCIHKYGIDDYNCIGSKDIACANIISNSVPITLTASRKSSKKVRRIYIEEENYTIEGDYMAQEVTIYHKPDKYGATNEKYNQENIIEKVVVNKIEPLRVELNTFLNCVKTNTKFPITIEEAIYNLEICDGLITDATL